MSQHRRAIRYHQTFPTRLHPPQPNRPTPQTEYRAKVLTKLFGGNRYYGCYFLTVAIFSLGIFRDFLYERALRSQPVYQPLVDSPLTQPLAILLFLGGNTLVLTSMLALGVTGTYLGDYFGILMDDMVTGFPFNVSSCPMYLGSTMSFAATALWFAKPAGLLLTVEVWIVYWLALKFEE
jgi:phosphatidylethanolamine N-methyltransferase